jgi:hypothetical protein
MFEVHLKTKLIEKILFGAGDLLAQHTVEKKPLSQSDSIRTCRMVFYGGGMIDL